MPETASIVELNKAIQLLFNLDGSPAMPTMERLDLKGLQKAFRLKALQTHPDRSVLLGKSETEMMRRFNEISSAYELLKPIAQKGVGLSFFNQSRSADKPRAGSQRKKPSPPSGPDLKNKRAEAPPTTKSRQNLYYQGGIPRFPMTVSQFLYYSGAISWRTHIESILWENKKCPRFGQIARRWKMISADEVMKILKEKSPHEKFGEYALKTGRITPFQQMAIIGRQRMLKPLPGEFFLEKGLFSSFQIRRIHEKTVLHNQQHPSIKGR